MFRSLVPSAARLLPVLLLPAVIQAADWPMFGRDPTRNSVSREMDPPVEWDVGGFDRRRGHWIQDSSKNIKWVARLGGRRGTFSLAMAD